MNVDEVAKKIRSILAKQKLKVDYQYGETPLYQRAQNAHNELTELAEILEKESIIKTLKECLKNNTHQ